MGEEDPGALVRNAEGEHVAIAALAVLEHRTGTEHPARRLEQPRRFWAGWQLIGHASSLLSSLACAATSAANAGKSFAYSCCGPSQSAASGSSATSTMIPSAPAAAAARARGPTRRRSPDACEGS